MKWEIGYSNDTGGSDDYFVEWWSVSKGERSFKCDSEDDANFLQSVLNQNN